MNKVLITGVNGQDGSFLAELLLKKGYEVAGTLRRTSQISTINIEHFKNDIKLYYADLTDASSLQNVFEDFKPDHVYNLAAQSFVKASFDNPVYTHDVNALGVVRLLELCRKYDCKMYQASTSEMFGSSLPPQHLKTPFHPRSPYGVSKLAAHWQVINYRESYDVFACNGILFNHESERRGLEFVTRKVVKAAAMIKKGLLDKLHLGYMDAKRDWGFAGDYVKAMYLMMNSKYPRDFVIATGESHSVREMCDIAFKYIGLDYNEHVLIDNNLYRPAEVNHLMGDATEAKFILGWRPKYTFEMLIHRMVKYELSRIQNK